jgi:nucleotide-binding universal stress UspA family protein
MREHRPVTSGRIIAGIDGSSGADAALRWAADEADLRDAELVALLAWGYLDQHPIPGHEGFDPEYGQADAEEAANEYVARALGANHRPVTVKAICDLPARALLEASAGADLLVMGARGIGGFRGLLVGSVTQRCLNETTVALALIHEPHLGDPSGPVVVGVDGSDNAAVAYRWAYDEAGRRGAHLKAVYAWQEPMGGGESFGLVVDDAALEEAAVDTVEKVVTTASGDASPITVERVAARGRAAPVLIEESASAALVVVGHRGHRRWGRVALGSVAQQVAHHGRCPVVVVPLPA